MNLIRGFRSSLARKVFFSYLIIILVGSATLLLTAELVMPLAFQRHMAAMAAEMGEASDLAKDLYENFRRALSEAAIAAVLAATLFAILLSLYVSRRMVQPVKDMQRITERIAEGHYRERIAIKFPQNGAEDLDELERLSLCLNRMAENLESTERMRRQLIGNVAHELRTPLAAIKGYIEALIDGVLPADVPTLANIYREADRLERLVADLQQLSQLEERAFQIKYQPLDLNALVRTVSDRLLPQFQAKGVRLTLNLAPDLPNISGDADRLSQVLINLLGNALQYTPSGKSVTIRS